VAPTDQTTVTRQRSTREERAQPALSPSTPQLAVAFSQALDLAEGRSAGHAARVCFIALRLADAAELEPADRQAVFYGSLLHDAGAAPASSALCRQLNMTEETLFAAKPGLSPQQLALEIAPQHGPEVVEVLRSHVELGATVARDLGLGEDVCQAILSHHERWDGQGYPHALKGDAIPLVGRIVAAADIIESLIGAESNPLTARRNLLATLAEHSGRTMDPDIARSARDFARSDEFWLGLHDDEIHKSLGTAIPAPKSDRKGDPFATFARVFGDLADTKGEHTATHGSRTADLAKRLAEAAGLDAEHCRLVHIAAMLHDVGLLGVAARVIAKPDILSLTEMEAMRRHPTFSQQVLEVIPGLEDVALWVGAHHERPDGKGYPELLDSEVIPIEARIIALADTYVALTSTRPYRRALSDEDAQTVLLGGAGSQLDTKLVQLFCSAAVATSSRSAPRSAQTR
jgi:HD-GYP domain-containing protein (c-di-GMP phosphodiesterase class II)